MPKEGRSREATLVSGIIAALREIPGCVVRKRHGTAWGVAGDPDLYGSINGRHFEIEVKRRGEVPTPIQRVRLADWARSGALAGVAHSVEEAVAIVCSIGRSTGPSAGRPALR